MRLATILALHIVQQLEHVRLGIVAFAGIPGAKHTGLSSKGIHHQSRIVRHTRHAVTLLHISCLLQRVPCKSGLRLR